MIEVPEQLEHTIGSDGLLVIRSASGDVRLRGVSGDKVLVRADDPTDLADLDVTRGAHSLEIGRVDGQRAAGGTSARRASIDLAIDVLAGASVVIDVASADIEVHGLTCDQRYRSSSGDLSIDGAAGHVTTEAMSGDIDVRADGPGAFDLRTVSGDLRLRGGSIATLRASTTSGDIQIEGTFDGLGPYLIQSVSGDVGLEPAGPALIGVRTITGELHNDIGATRHPSSDVRTIQIGGGGPVIDVRSTSGDVTVSGRAAAPGAAMTAPDVATADDAESSTDETDAQDNDARLDILRAVERGDLDVGEATQRLDDLDELETGEEDVARVG